MRKWYFDSFLKLTLLFSAVIIRGERLIALKKLLSQLVIVLGYIISRTQCWNNFTLELTFSEKLDGNKYANCYIVTQTTTVNWREFDDCKGKCFADEGIYLISHHINVLPVYQRFQAAACLVLFLVQFVL